MRKEFCCHPRDQTEMENNINEYEFLRKLLLLSEAKSVAKATADTIYGTF